MSLELINTLASLGTFLVIAATAVAAIVQLRQVRSSNHIAALNEIRETREAPDFQAAEHFIFGRLSVKMQEPAFRYCLGAPAAAADETRTLIGMITKVGDFYEGWDYS